MMSVYAVKRKDNNSMVATFEEKASAYQLRDNFERSSDYYVGKHVVYGDLQERNNLSRG